MPGGDVFASDAIVAMGADEAITMSFRWSSRDVLAAARARADVKAASKARAKGKARSGEPPSADDDGYGDRDGDGAEADDGGASGSGLAAGLTLGLRQVRDASVGLLYELGEMCKQALFAGAPFETCTPSWFYGLVAAMPGFLGDIDRHNSACSCRAGRLAVCLAKARASFVVVCRCVVRPFLSFRTSRWPIAAKNTSN